MCVRVMCTCEAKAGARGVTPTMLSGKTKRDQREEKRQGDQRGSISPNSHVTE